jgi:hypothetical protein
LNALTITQGDKRDINFGLFLLLLATVVASYCAIYVASYCAIYEMPFVRSRDQMHSNAFSARLFIKIMHSGPGFLSKSRSGPGVPF